MIHNIDIAKKIAKYLLQINAIILKPNNPFKWAGGWNSPIYCDNRKTLAYPKIRNYIKKSLSDIIREKHQKTDVIAGVATAGIPHGALIAEELNIPFIYVRAKAKEHGKQNQIEGYFKKDQSVVLVEDLISSGKSSIDASNALSNAGMKVNGIISIFTYNFDHATKYFKETNNNYTSLCDYNTLLEEALKQKSINNNELSILKKWRKNPATWKK